MFYIYHHINKKTGEVFYVGQGKNQRAYSMKSRSSFWHAIVEKYGYDVLIVEERLTKEQANEREIYWIKEIGRRDLGKGPLVNLTDGGDSIHGYIFTEDVTKKMSESRLGEKNGFYGRKHSEESRMKMSASKKGKTTHMKGKNLSDETKEKLRNINKGKVLSQETKEKISKANKGRCITGHSQTEETREKIRLSCSGENNKRRKIVLQLDMNGNVIREWPSVAEIKRSLGVCHVDKCCRGIRNHAGGFKWMYKNEIEE